MQGGVLLQFAPRTDNVYIVSLQGHKSFNPLHKEEAKLNDVTF